MDKKKIKMELYVNIYRYTEAYYDRDTRDDAVILTLNNHLLHFYNGRKPTSPYLATFPRLGTRKTCPSNNKRRARREGENS